MFIELIASELKTSDPGAPSTEEIAAVLTKVSAFVLQSLQEEVDLRVSAEVTHNQQLEVHLLRSRSQKV